MSTLLRVDRGRLRIPDHGAWVCRAAGQFGTYRCPAAPYRRRVNVCPGGADRCGCAGARVGGGGSSLPGQPRDSMMRLMYKGKALITLCPGVSGLKDRPKRRETAPSLGAGPVPRPAAVWLRRTPGAQDPLALISQIACTTRDPQRVIGVSAPWKKLEEPVSRRGRRASTLLRTRSRAEQIPVSGTPSRLCGAA